MLSGSSISSESGNGSGPGFGSGYRVLMTKNLREKIQLKIFSFFGQKLQLLSLDLLQGHLSSRRSLQPSKNKRTSSTSKNVY
jgi:hypothetical protein